MVRSGMSAASHSSSSATGPDTPLAMITNSVSVNSSASASPQAASVARPGTFSSSAIITALTDRRSSGAVAAVGEGVLRPVMFLKHIQNVVYVINLAAEDRNHPRTIHRRLEQDRAGVILLRTHQ